MLINPSKSALKEIKEHKNLFEKQELFDYALKFNGNTYFHANYSRFGNVVGLLIVKENGTVSKEEAIQPTIIFNHYNTYIHEVINIMIPETRKSIKPFEDIVMYLSDLIDSSSPEYVNETLRSFKYIVDTRKEQESYIYKIRDIQNNVLDSVGYLTEEDLTEVRNYSEAFSRGQYMIAVKQFEVLEDAKETIKWLKTLNQSHESLINILNECVTDRSMNILKKAHHKNSLDYEGNTVNYPPGEEGGDKWIEVYREIVKKSTEKNVLSLLRNR